MTCDSKPESVLDPYILPHPHPPLVLLKPYSKNGRSMSVGFTSLSMWFLSLPNRRLSVVKHVCPSVRSLHPPFLPKRLDPSPAKNSSTLNSTRNFYPYQIYYTPFLSRSPTPTRDPSSPLVSHVPTPTPFYGSSEVSPVPCRLSLGNPDPPFLPFPPTPV